MDTNVLPVLDRSDNSTGCCARFNPQGWDDQRLRFRDRRFLRATTRSVMYVPVDMGKVFARVSERIEAAGAADPKQYLVLSRSLSPFADEHLFAVTRDVPDEEMVTLSGEFLTRVYEGPYREARHWDQDLQDRVRQAGGSPGRVYFFYTTCPNCAKAYGKNYVVGVAEILPAE